MKTVKLSAVMLAILATAPTATFAQAQRAIPAAARIVSGIFARKAGTSTSGTTNDTLVPGTAANPRAPGTGGGSCSGTGTGAPAGQSRGGTAQGRRGGGR